MMKSVTAKTYPYHGLLSGNPEVTSDRYLCDKRSVSEVMRLSGGYRHITSLPD
jgi:hypothetical protein